MFFKRVLIANSRPKLGAQGRLATLVSSYTFCNQSVLMSCVRVASSTWNVLWLWNTNKGRPQQQVPKATWKFAGNLIKQQRQRRSLRMLKVASSNGLNSRRMKLEQS